MTRTHSGRTILRGCIPALVAVAMMLSLAQAAVAAPTRILIVRGEAPELPGGTMIVEAFQSALRAEFEAPVEFYVETIDTARFPGQAYERRLAELLAEKYGGSKPDLVLAFSAPAVDFVLNHGSPRFPGVPVLFGLIDRRFLESRALTGKTAAVFVQVDASATLRLALSVYPRTRKVIVVGGSSDFDREWMRSVRADLEEFGPKLPISYDTDSRVEDLAWMVAALPSDTIVLFVSMTRDGANTATRPPDVVQRMSEAASVPVFGVSTTYLGRGIVGGALVDHQRHGVDLAHQAARLLRGESPPPITTQVLTAVDWRAMQRFGLSSVSLPRSIVVANREPGLWERNKGAVIAGTSLVVLEGGLIFALILLVRRRREAQQLLEGELAFQSLSLDLTLSLTKATPREIEDAVQAGLSRVASAIGVDWVWRWQFEQEEDRGWDSPQLRAGQPVVFDRATELPPAIREKLRMTGSEACSAIAVPCATLGHTPGALFWVSPGGEAPRRALVDDLQVISTMITNVLQRRFAESAFQQSDALKGAILDSLPAQVAVLDREGRIIAVNDAWIAYVREKGAASEASVGPGVTYRSACLQAAGLGEPFVREALAMIEAACGGTAGQQMEYQGERPDREQWFLMRAEPLRWPEGGAVVTHTDITGRKLNEIALRESESRFRRMADALPVAVWMSEPDGSCSYVNRQWLQMTGRSVEQESGWGWLEAVHPDDRASCSEIVIGALHAKRRFTMEYRIRRHDGVYRWLLDIGVPRYGSEGVFYGYVGGAVDMTEEREAEQVLRDFNRKLLAAQEEERRHIARELHDHLSQQLALLAINLQQLSAHIPASPEALASSLEEQWRRIGEIASDVHAISHRLHPSKLEALGLVATIRAHCRDLSQEGVTVHFSEHGPPEPVARDVALCLFRVLEEALSNVVRHSGATEADVALLDGDSDVVLRVSDAGSGFRLSGRRLHGLGLVSMRERVQGLGGTLSITSTPGKGTVVEARVSRLGTAHPQRASASAHDVAEPA